MYNWLKISHHHHSGRLRPHEYTSYVPLAFLLLFVGLALLGCSVSALSSPPPQADSVALSGTMPQPAPTVAATITSPAPQKHFTASPVSVSGTCPPNTLVEVYKNDIFAGSGPCSDSGTYSFEVDLLFGRNSLIARVYDALNQPGPDSRTVTVFYDALPPQSAALAPLSFGGAQLLLNTDAVYRGAFPEHLLNVPIDIIGGTPPYAVNVQWGDSTNKVISRNDNLTFNASHAYHKPGTYQISIQASDAKGRVAFITVAAIVNGQPSAVPAGTSSGTPANKLLLLWPLYTAAAAIVTSFWLGERREKHLLTGSNLTFHPQV